MRRPDIRFVKVRRTCGGGIPVLRRKFWWRYPGYRIQWNVILRLRRTDGAIIWDWPGIALAWKGDWD